MLSCGRQRRRGSGIGRSRMRGFIGRGGGGVKDRVKLRVVVGAGEALDLADAIADVKHHVEGLRRAIDPHTGEVFATSHTRPQDDGARDQDRCGLEGLLLSHWLQIGGSDASNGEGGVGSDGANAILHQRRARVRTLQSEWQWAAKPIEGGKSWEWRGREMVEEGLWGRRQRRRLGQGWWRR